MKAIIDKVGQFIEQWALDEASPLRVKNFGFAEIVNRTSRGKSGISNQPIPITIPGDGSEAVQISLDDNFDFIFWIRTTGRIFFTLEEDDSWGLKQGRRQNLPLRIVIAHRNNLGEDLVYNLVQDFPEKFVVTAYDMTFVDSIGQVNDDHETIHNTELGLTNYEKHRFTWNIYAIDFNIQFVPCTNFEPESINLDDIITDDNGNFLTAS